MQRSATKSNDRVLAKPNVFNAVFGKKRKRVRGIWIRNGVIFAQVRIADQVKQLPLHDANTIAQAIRERQALKSTINNGSTRPSGIKRKQCSCLPARSQVNRRPNTLFLLQSKDTERSGRCLLRCDLGAAELHG